MTSAPPRVAPRDGIDGHVSRRIEVPTRSPADGFMRKLLRIHDTDPLLGEDELRRGFSQSMVISGLRCLLTYLIFPWILPILGVAAGVGPVIGIPIGALAITFNIRTMRRFWAADHKWRWGYTIIGATVMAMLLVVIAVDIARVVS